MCWGGYADIWRQSIIDVRPQGGGQMLTKGQEGQGKDFLNPNHLNCRVQLDWKALALSHNTHRHIRTH